MLLLWWLMPVQRQAIVFLAVLIAASALQAPLPHRDRASLHARLGVERCPHYAIDTTRRLRVVRAGPAVSRVEMHEKALQERRAR